MTETDVDGADRNSKVRNRWRDCATTHDGGGPPAVAGPVAGDPTPAALEGPARAAGAVPAAGTVFAQEKHD